MGEAFGLGDGNNDISGLGGLADSKVSEAQRRQRGPVESGRWPEASTVVRVLVFAVALLVILGWGLTAINS